MDRSKNVSKTRGSRGGVQMKGSKNASKASGSRGKGKQPAEPSHELPIIQVNGDEFSPLSGKPYFDLILTKSTLNQMVMPKRVHKLLPDCATPTVLMCKGKEWAMVYRGEAKHNRYFEANWKNFVMDKGLKVGDGLVFEVVECSDTIKLKVLILRS